MCALSSAILQTTVGTSMSWTSQTISRSFSGLGNSHALPLATGTTARRRLKRASRTARANAESMVAFGVQPEFTCKLAGEEHGTDDADDVAGVRFVGVLKV